MNTKISLKTFLMHFALYDFIKKIQLFFHIVLGYSKQNKTIKFICQKKKYYFF